MSLFTWGHMFAHPGVATDMCAALCTRVSTPDPSEGTLVPPRLWFNYCQIITGGQRSFGFRRMRTFWGAEENPYVHTWTGHPFGVLRVPIWDPWGSHMGYSECWSCWGPHLIKVPIWDLQRTQPWRPGAHSIRIHIWGPSGDHMGSLRNPSVMPWVHIWVLSGAWMGPSGIQTTMGAHHDQGSHLEYMLCLSIWGPPHPGPCSHRAPGRRGGSAARPEAGRCPCLLSQLHIAHTRGRGSAARHRGCL